MKYAVVIPVYNERALFPLLLARLEGTPAVAVPDSATDERLERVIVVVDDGSADGTREIVRGLEGRAGIRVVLHERNRGKGAAVRSGFRAALAEDEVGIILIQDADLEYDPRDHGRVLAPILDGRADAVFGSRFLGETHRVLYFWHAVANRFITLLSNVFTNLNLTDIECCFKAFRREVLERIEIEEDRFGVEPELVAKVATVRVPVAGEGASGGAARERPARVFEVPISYAGRTYEEGKKITWRDGVAAVGCIVKYGVRRGGRKGGAKR